MKKVLPIHDSPVSYLPGYAFTTYIILNYKTGQDWFAQKYMSSLLIYNETYDVPSTEFCNITTIPFINIHNFQLSNIWCPLTDVHSVPRDLISHFKIDIIDFIEHYIDQNKYLVFYVNRSYIKEHDDYDVTHELLVYGYDRNRNELHICDYFKKGNLRPSTCSYQEMANAFNNASEGLQLDDGGYYHFFSSEKINILSYNELYKFEFDQTLFVKEIKYYLGLEHYNLNYKPVICDPKKIQSYLHTGV